MSLTTSEMTPADIAAVTNNGCNDRSGGWGGDWGAWIILFLIFSMFGWGGFGGFGGFGGNAGMNGALTRADLCQDMNFSQLENGVRGIQQGICDSTYAFNNSINGLGTTVMQGFHGVDNAVCNLGYQTQQGQNALQTRLSDCCFQTQRAIDNVNYNMATNTCSLQNTMNSNTRDIIDSQNAGTRAILDYLCQDKISTLQSENQALRLAASQSAQNAVLMAAMDANTASIIRRTGNDCPIPAYVVPNPNCCYGTPNVNFGNNCGCSGCGV